MIFLATNRPFDLDEAMQRRITSVFEFRAPNHIQVRAAVAGWRAGVGAREGGGSGGDGCGSASAVVVTGLRVVGVDR